MSKKKGIWRIGLMAILFLIWEVICSGSRSNLFLVPPPSAIFLRLSEHPERFLHHAQVTFKEMFGGMFAAIITAFPLAWLMSRWSQAASFLQPIFVFIQCIPMFVLAPLMVFWFGWSYTAIVIPTALMIFFPLTITLYQGLGSTPVSYLDFFRLHRATAWQVFTKLQLPWSMPHLFAGLKISASIAGIGAVAGEWAGGQEGLGVLMLESRRAADLPTVFSALSCLAAMSCLLYCSIVLIEKQWKRQTWGTVISLFLCIMLAGCQSGTHEKDAPTRLLLDWLPNPNHVPLYVGIEKGIFKQHGIDIQLLKIQDPSDGIPYLTSGQADLSVFYTTETMRAIHRGGKLKQIGTLINHPLNSLIFLKKSGIQQISDLENKVIGYSSDGSGSKLIDHLLKLNGIRPKKVVNVSFDLIGSLSLGHVDAIFGAFWNIESEHLQHIGMETRFFEVMELGYPFYNELIFIAQEGTLQTTEPYIHNFQQALQDSILYSTHHPDEAFQIYAQRNQDKSRETLTWERAAWNNTIPLLAQSQSFNRKEWIFLFEWLKTGGYLE